MKNKKGNILVVALAILALVGISVAGYFFWQNNSLDRIAPPSNIPIPSSNVPLSWEECIKYPASTITLSYPGTCHLPDGRSVIQPPDDTSNWKIYTDKFISFNYSDTWKIYETNTEVNKNQPNAPTFLILRVNSSDFQGNGVDEFFQMTGVSLKVIGVDQRKSEKTWKSSEEYFYNYLPPEERNKNYFLVPFNNTTWVLHDLGNSSGRYVTGWDAVVYATPNYFEFTVSVPNSQKDEGKKILYQILSTFKFL